MQTEAELLTTNLFEKCFCKRNSAISWKVVFKVMILCQLHFDHAFFHAAGCTVESISFRDGKTV